MHLQDITLDGSLQSGNLGLSLNSMNPGANFTLQLDGIFSRQGINTGIGLELVDLDLQRLGFSETPLAGKLRLRVSSAPTSRTRTPYRPCLMV